MMQRNTCTIKTLGEYKLMFFFGRAAEYQSCEYDRTMLSHMEYILKLKISSDYEPLHFT